MSQKPRLNNIIDTDTDIHTYIHSTQSKNLIDFLDTPWKQHAILPLRTFGNLYNI